MILITYGAHDFAEFVVTLTDYRPFPEMRFAGLLALYPLPA